MAEAEEMTVEHPKVMHPAELLAAERRIVGRFNDWAVGHMAAIFGAVWTIWAFFVWPLLVLLLPAVVQNTTFYLASGWVQLFALPLFVYIGMRIQRSQDAQSAVQHEALTHIAATVDEIKAKVTGNA